MKIFVVRPEDVGERVLVCGGCLWDVQKLYVLAKTKGEAVKLVKNGEAGLCGDCMCEMLSDEEYAIVGRRKKPEA